MAGKNIGVQAHLKQKNNLADYVPCDAAHSLNLVDREAVKAAPEIVNFFGIIQQLYVFFSVSTHRWELLNSKTKLKFSIEKNEVRLDGLVNTMQ